jgi:hypothetical protein
MNEGAIADACLPNAGMAQGLCRTKRKGQTRSKRSMAVDVAAINDARGQMPLKPCQRAEERCAPGLEPGATTFPFTVNAPCTTTTHGDPCLYGSAVVPSTEAAEWKSAPDPDVIGFSRSSTVSCFRQVDYTYFQTFVHVPTGSTVTTFRIDLSGADDGARITIYNTAYPSGILIPGSYVYLGAASTANLASYILEGVNRVVITQVDDCAVGNNLRSATVTLNGSAVLGVCRA